MQEQKSLLNYAMAAYIALILFLQFGGALLPPGIGVYNMLISQIGVLIIAVVPVIIARVPFSEVFPVKKPLGRQIGAVILIWIGLFLVNTVINLLLTYGIADNIIQRNVAVTDSIGELPVIAGFIIVALMPAIGEEALCRGLLLRGFSGIQNKWLLTGLVGLMFGMAHMDILVLPGTMLLGIAMGIIMYETRNIFLPFLFHLINNAFAVSVLSAVPTDGIADAAADFMNDELIMTLGLGTYLIFCAASPFLCYFGSRLLKPKAEAPPISKKPLLICAAIAVCVFIPGVILFGVGFMNYYNEFLGGLF